MLARMRMGHHRLGLRNLGAVSILAALCAVASCRCGGGGNAPLLCAPTPSGMTQITHTATSRTYGSPVLRDVCQRLVDSSRGALVCAPTPSGMTVITNIETGATLGSPVLVEECEQTIASR